MLTQTELTALEFKPAAIIVTGGAPFSHPMIRLLALGVPTVLVSEQMARQLECGKAVFVDGLTGTVEQPPPSNVNAISVSAPPPVAPPLILSDGSEVQLRASICGSEEASKAVNHGAAAIGLVRTEFLVPDQGRLPDAAFYRSVLSALCDAARPLAVTLRLPDISQDKPVPWLEQTIVAASPLGLLGVRLFDKEPLTSVINALVDAVNELAKSYSIKLLLPYVTQLEEFRYWHSVLERRLHNKVLIGAMLESPAAILALPHWFEIADFVAIGCNDLMQCLFGADRDIAELSPYLDAYSPQLFLFLQQAANAAGDHIDRLQLCGLLSQRPGVLPILLGMGFRAFSVAPVMLPYLAQTVKQIDLADARALARQVCEAKHHDQVRELL
jgi:phosphoenolpyruvate-protein kinase (PTS system EI component)